MYSGKNKREASDAGEHPGAGSTSKLNENMVPDDTVPMAKVLVTGSKVTPFVRLLILHVSGQSGTFKIKLSAGPVPVLLMDMPAVDPLQ